jgi:hypothetical protein
MNVTDGQVGLYSFQQSLNRTLNTFNTAIDDLYPNRANPPLPRTLPLEAYTGTYFHPGYLNITIELSDVKERLQAVRKDFVWPMTFDFVRVSGDYWVVYIDMLETPNQLNGQLAKAEFRIGARGKVDELVVEFLEDGSEGLVTFKKIV